MISKTICLFAAAIIFLGAYFIEVMAKEKEQNQAAKMDHKQIFSTKTNKLKCYQSTKYLVVAKDLEQKGGTDFLVKYKSNANEKLPCSYVFVDYDFEIKNEWAEYFAGLTGDSLILDSTTGPGPSGLTIWDLKKRKKVYEGLWAGPTKIKDDSIIYWKETEEATKDNCPEGHQWQSHGLGAAIETKVILNLSDFTISKTKERRCSPRQ